MKQQPPGERAAAARPVAVRSATTVAAITVAALGLAAAPAAAESQLWLEAGVRHDVSKRLELGFDQHLRFDADISRVGSFMPEPGLAYKVKKWLRLGGGYRLEYERDKDGVMVVRHRLFAWGRLRHDAGDLRLGYRLQLQEQIRPDANPVNRHVVRNRGELSYRGLGAVVPSGEIELHHILGEEGNTAHLGKVWLTAGVGYERGDVSFDVYYRAEVAQYDPDDPTVHILGVGAHYQL